MTWQKLSAIQAACGIELTFDRCLAVVKAAEAQERADSSSGSHLPRRGNMRSRIPSWSCMATAGEAHPSLHAALRTCTRVPWYKSGSFPGGQEQWLWCVPVLRCCGTNS